MIVDIYLVHKEVTIHNNDSAPAGQGGASGYSSQGPHRHHAPRPPHQKRPVARKTAADPDAGKRATQPATTRPQKTTAPPDPLLDNVSGGAITDEKPLPSRE
jgi:hypothetical protein